MSQLADYNPVPGLASGMMDMKPWPTKPEGAEAVSAAQGSKKGGRDVQAGGSDEIMKRSQAAVASTPTPMSCGSTKTSSSAPRAGASRLERTGGCGRACRG